MVPISMAGMKKIWLNSFHVMSNVKIFATQDGQRASWLAGQTNTIHHTDPYDTHMIQKMETILFQAKGLALTTSNTTQQPNEMFTPGVWKIHSYTKQYSIYTFCINTQRLNVLCSFACHKHLSLSLSLSQALSLFPLPIHLPTPCPHPLYLTPHPNVLVSKQSQY